MDCSASAKGLLQRWSFLVPVFFYLCFLGMIWSVSVPLKSQQQQQPSSLRRIGEILAKRQQEAGLLQQPQPRPIDNINLRERAEYLVNAKDEEYLSSDPRNVLETVFHKADRDQNEKLDLRELADWINKQIISHITTAIRDNVGLFTMIDVSPRNGVVSWNEYHMYFLKKKGLSEKYVNSHDEKRHRGLKRSLKEQIMKDKASWMEAAKSDPDALSVDEFLSFTHPESSAANLLQLVDELYEKFDRNGDEILTEDEFASLQQAEGDDLVVRQAEAERRAEFRRNVDANADGRADRRELLHYIAPQSPRHSEHEAEALMALADADNDHFLTLSEILAHPDLFLRSKMVDTAGSFHDEF